MCVLKICKNNVHIYIVYNYCLMTSYLKKIIIILSLIDQVIIANNHIFIQFLTLEEVKSSQFFLFSPTSNKI